MSAHNKTMFEIMEDVGEVADSVQSFDRDKRWAEPVRTLANAIYDIAARIADEGAAPRIEPTPCPIHARPKSLDEAVCRALNRHSDTGRGNCLGLNPDDRADCYPWSTSPEGVYTMMNHLADRGFLTGVTPAPIPGAPDRWIVRVGPGYSHGPLPWALAEVIEQVSK